MMDNDCNYCNLYIHIPNDCLNTHASSHCGNAVGQPLLPEDDDETGSREALEHWSNQVPISCRMVPVLLLGADWNMNSGVDSG